MEKKEVAAQQCVAIPITKIKQEDNSRAYQGDNVLPELMRSMRETGLLQPIGVRAVGKGYEVVWGNRRYEAARKLGWKTIEAFVVEAAKDEQMYILNAIENMQRRDISPSEQGRIFDGLVKGGLKPAEIAARIGVSTWKVTQALSVFRDVPAKYRAMVTNKTGPAQGTGTLPLHTAEAIVRATSGGKLPPGAKKALFEYARENVMHDTQVRTATTLMRGGVPIQKALKTLEGVRNVHLAFGCKAAVVAKLEKKTGKTVRELMLRELAKNKQFGVLTGSFPTTNRFKGGKRKILGRAKKADTAGAEAGGEE